MNTGIKRIGQSALTLFIVLHMTFGIVRLLPGGPMEYMRAQILAGGSGALGGTTDPEKVNEITQAYLNINPSKPLWEQYLDYMGALLHGDFGRSIWLNEPVSAVLGEALPWTVFVMTLGITITFVLAILLGAAMAYKEGSTVDTLLTGLFTLSNAIPYYIVAILLLYVLAYQYQYFPLSGKLPEGVQPGLTLEFVTGALYHATLPTISLVISGVGIRALQMRGNSIRILGEDYLRVAQLRGLPDHRIASDYIARNAVLPLYTSLMIYIGYILGGSILLEQIFNYHGVGYYMYQSITTRDTPLMMGSFLLITTGVVVGILLAELTYGLIDPRASSGGDADDVF